MSANSSSAVSVWVSGKVEICFVVNFEICHMKIRNFGLKSVINWLHEHRPSMSTTRRIHK